MEPEQPQQQLPLCESHNHQHVWAAFPHRNRLQEPPLQRIPSSPLVMCCGSREIWGLQEAGGSVELICEMPWIQCETGPQANLYFPGCPCRKHCPYIPTRVCVWAGGEQSYSKARRREESLAKEWHPFCPFPTQPMVLLLPAAAGHWGGRWGGTMPPSPTTCGIAPVGCVRNKLLSFSFHVNC